MRHLPRGGPCGPMNRFPRTRPGRCGGAVCGPLVSYSNAEFKLTGNANITIDRSTYPGCSRDSRPRRNWSPTWTRTRSSDVARRPNNTGFTLIEILLAVTIAGLLMAAVGTAFHASMTSYRENQKIAAVTQTARSVLNRMTRDIRAAAAINVQPLQVTIVPVDDGSGTEEIRYEYDYDNQRLYCRRTVGGTTTSYPLLGGDGVEAVTFYATSKLGKDWQDVTCTKSVTVRLEFRIGGQTCSVTATASPRRNQLY